MSIQEKINQLAQAALCRDETRDFSWRPVTFMAVTPVAPANSAAAGDAGHRWTNSSEPQTALAAPSEEAGA